jgi:hypothetical protein
MTGRRSLTNKAGAREEWGGNARLSVQHYLYSVIFHHRGSPGPALQKSLPARSPPTEVDARQEVPCPFTTVLTRLACVANGPEDPDGGPSRLSRLARTTSHYRRYI